MKVTAQLSNKNHEYLCRTAIIHKKVELTIYL